MRRLAWLGDRAQYVRVSQSATRSDTVAPYLCPGRRRMSKLGVTCQQFHASADHGCMIEYAKRIVVRVGRGEYWQLTEELLFSKAYSRDHERNIARTRTHIGDHAPVAYDRALRRLESFYRRRPCIEVSQRSRRSPMSSARLL